MKRLVFPTGFCLVVMSSCCLLWDEEYISERCYGSATPGYQLRGWLVGVDGCPFEGLEVRLRVIEEGDDDFADSPRKMDSSDSSGELHFAWGYGASHMDFTTCMTEAELMADIREEVWAPRLDRVELTFVTGGVVRTLHFELSEDLLPSYSPVLNNTIALGAVIVEDVEACDPLQYKDLDLFGLCKLLEPDVESSGFADFGGFCEQVRAGAIENVEHYCRAREAGEAEPFDEFCLVPSAVRDGYSDGYTATREAWCNEPMSGQHYAGWDYVLSGDCIEEGVRFLAREMGGMTHRFYFAAGTDEFLGMEKSYDAEQYFVPPCCGNLVWPERVECTDPTVAEVICGPES